MKIWRFEVKYKIVIAFGVIRNEFRGWGFMRQTNVTNIKEIGPCVQELEVKMRVKLAHLVVTLFWQGSILPSISQKTMNNEDLVHSSSFFRPLIQLNPSTLTDSKARTAHMLSSKVNQKSLKSDRYFIHVYPWPAHNGSQLKCSSPSYPFWAW